MSLFDGSGPFGDLFDLDGDGKTDAIEEATAFALLDEMIEEESDSDDDDDTGED